MSSGEYDLKKSEDKIGQLYPVLLSKDGKVIDGLHRLKSDEGWRTETLEHIDDEEKLLVARAISNWHRREIPRTEKEEWINGLAKIYLNQGLKVALVREKGGYENQIINRIAKVTGLSIGTVSQYLNKKFKQEISQASLEGARTPKVPASQAIKSKVGGEYGESLVERHETEVLEKALEDPEFVLKAIEKAPEVLKARPRAVVDKEGYHLPTIDKTTQKEAKQRGVEIAKEREEFIARPDIIEKSRLLKAWRALSVILGSSKDLICPLCNGEAEIILKCKNCGEVPLSEAQRVAKEAVT